MKKLLHDRLMECDDGVTEFLPRELADEIERYYIPRPRFEDGTPMHLGDMCDFGDYFHKDERVKEIFGLHYVNGGEWSVQPLNESYNARLDNCKLPAPKVYDADGVPCNENETVFDIRHGAELQIKRLTDDRRILCEYGDGLFGHYLASEVTHERPVFDAEGVRICKGDMVWHVGDASRGTVVSVIRDNTWHGYPVKVAWDKGDEGFYQGDALTHREPDSIDRILDDATQDPRHYYNAHIGHDVGLRDDSEVITAFAQHLIGRAQAVTENTALIERGA